MAATSSHKLVYRNDEEGGTKTEVQESVSYEDLNILGDERILSYSSLMNKLALGDLWDRLSDQDRLILQHLLEGFSMQEICWKVNLSAAQLKLRVRKMVA